MENWIAGGRGGGVCRRGLGFWIEGIEVIERNRRDRKELKGID